MLRRLAVWASCDEGLWLRTCYGKELEEGHQTVWDNYVSEHDAIDLNALVLDDPELFQGPWTAMLEIFPERVTNSCGDDREELVARRLNELREREGRGDDDSEEKRESQRELYANLGRHEFLHEMCRRYRRYHSACIVTHVFVEDRQSQEGEELLHVYLDDKGNVVRQIREEPEALDNFTGAWLDLCFDKGPAFEEYAEVGPAYLPGGARGPPYSQGPGPYWLQLIDYPVQSPHQELE